MSFITSCFRYNYRVDDDVLRTWSKNRSAKGTLSNCLGFLRLSFIRIHLCYYNTVRGRTLLHQVWIGRMLFQFWSKWHRKFERRRRHRWKSKNQLVKKYINKQEIINSYICSISFCFLTTDINLIKNHLNLTKYISIYIHRFVCRKYFTIDIFIYVYVYTYIKYSFISFLSI